MSNFGVLGTIGAHIIDRMTDGNVSAVSTMQVIKGITELNKAGNLVELLNAGGETAERLGVFKDAIGSVKSAKGPISSASALLVDAAVRLYGSIDGAKQFFSDLSEGKTSEDDLIMVVMAIDPDHSVIDVASAVDVTHQLFDGLPYMTRKAIGMADSMVTKVLGLEQLEPHSNEPSVEQDALRTSIDRYV